MTRKLRRAHSLLAIALFWLTATFATPIFAQSPDQNDAVGSLNEQSIYIPYEKLRDVFEKDGRGVFLPYEEFQKLWKAARANRTKATNLSAPIGSLITEIESIATLGSEIVQVDATVKIELLQKGWHRIPLRLKGAAISRASVGGREALLTSTQGGQFELLVSHDSDKPKTIELKLSYAKALSKTGGQSNVELQSPQAPVNRWIIRTGQKDIDVQIEPMIASTRKSADDDSDPSGDEIMAFVGAAPLVKIMWTPKSEGASGLAALVTATTQSRFQISQGVARTSATVSMDVTRSEIESVSLVVPADQKVVSVFDRNVKKWNVTKNGDLQQIQIELFEPALGRQTLLVELEQFVADVDDSSLKVPSIRVEGASRNNGVVMVGLATGLRAEPENKTGLMQMDASELPKNVADKNWGYIYRYAALPFDLTLNVEKIQPLVNVDQLIELTLRPEKAEFALSAIFDVKLAGLFEINLDVPKRFEIRDIRSITRGGLATISVDTYYRDPKNENRVIVTLGKKALGRFGLFVLLDEKISDANLLTPTGVTSTVDWDLPKVAIDGLEYSKGNLVVYSPVSLEVNAGETNGLRSESFQSVFVGHQASVSDTGVRPILAFDFANTPASIKLLAKRRRPQVTVEQIVVASVQSGVVKYDATFYYEVLYSGVNSFRIDVPLALSSELRNRSTAIHHQPMATQPDDVADGYVAWQLTGDNEFFGKTQIRFSWEQKTGDLPLGESTNIAVSRLIPEDVDRATGQIVLTKSETIDVQATPSSAGLRPIDPQTDLGQGKIVANAALAFEFVDNWNLDLMTTRFELQELKRTSVTRALIRVVALRQNELSIQCLYQMRSVGQRISIQMPKGFDEATSFDDQPVRVNGRSVTPERGGKDLIFIPLTAIQSDEAFLLELRYTVPGSHRQIDLPLFIDHPAIQKVYLCAYLPAEDVLIHNAGDWTDESVAHSSTVLSRIFNPRNQHIGTYLDWVTEGCVAGKPAAQKFEVDGHPYVFSALRPLPAPDGSLHLRTLNKNVLNLFACGLIGLIGLVLIRAKITTQLAGAILASGILMISGLFFPLVTEHLVGEALLATAAFVGLAWVCTHVFHFLRNARTAFNVRNENATPALAASGATEVPNPENSIEPESPPLAESPSDPSDSSSTDDSDKNGGSK